MFSLSQSHSKGCENGSNDSHLADHIATCLGLHPVHSQHLAQMTDAMLE